MKVYFAEEVWAALRWCSIIGLLPYYNSKMRRFIQNKGYTLFVHCILSLMYLFVIYKTVDLNYNVFIQIFLISLTVVSATLVNIKLSIWNVDDLSRLFYEIDQLDLELVKRCRLDVSVQKHMTSICAIVYVLNAFAYFSSIFTWKPEGHVSLMAVFCTVFDYVFAAQLTLQLIILHGICKRSMYVSRVVRGCSPNKYFESDFVTTIALLQRRVSRIADIFNELFGWNTFLHIIINFASILYVVYTFVNMHFSAEVTKSLLPYVVAILFQTLHILLLSMQGQAVFKDSDTIASFCCDLFANPKKDKNQNRARDLIQQVSMKQARISAAGFFDVNFAMLFLLFNLLITYVIALVQIMPK